MRQMEPQHLQELLISITVLSCVLRARRRDAVIWAVSPQAQQLRDECFLASPSTSWQPGHHCFVRVHSCSVIGTRLWYLETCQVSTPQHAHTGWSSKGQPGIHQDTTCFEVCLLVSAVGGVTLADSCPHLAYDWCLLLLGVTQNTTRVTYQCG